MLVQVPSTRRDVRHRIRRGSASVELPHPRVPGTRVTGRLYVLSVAGFAFELEADPEAFRPGELIPRVDLRVGDCLLQGELAVRDVRDVGGGRIEVGCLFYPTAHDEERWSALIAGIEVAMRQEEAAS